MLRQSYKRRFNVAEMYDALVFVPRAALSLINNRKNSIVDIHLVERLQLAVTEVNGCAACSYAHTKMALREGMSGEEIASFLSGSTDFIRPEEAKAIIFAQHFADTGGHPKSYAYDSLVDEYGSESAQIMLSAALVMLAGNVYGIPLSAFQSRLRNMPFPDSSLPYELGMLAVGPAILPIASIHGALRGLIGRPNERFDREPETMS